MLLLLLEVVVFSMVMALMLLVVLPPVASSKGQRYKHLSGIPLILGKDPSEFENDKNTIEKLKKMKLTDFMDNKVAGDLDYVMPADACADEGVLLEHKKDLHLREVNANEYYCPSHDSMSPVKTPEGHNDCGESDGTEIVCAERRTSSPENSRENQDGVSLDSANSTTSSSQENVSGDKSSASTEELDKEIFAIKAQINALDEISESELSHFTDDETADERERINDPESPERTLRQIRESLEEKVKNLREEKNVSDEKIRMAQEEDELRLQEKIKLRQQLLIHRKERLKKMIMDLKRKLDCQSHRLQSGYSSLLALQKTIFRSRSFSAKSRPPRRNNKDSAEAPF